MIKSSSKSKQTLKHTNHHKGQLKNQQALETKQHLKTFLKKTSMRIYLDNSLIFKMNFPTIKKPWNSTPEIFELLLTIILKLQVLKQ